MAHPEREPTLPDWRNLLAAYERTWHHHHEHPTEQTLAVLMTGAEILVRELYKPGRFDLGMQVMTPGVRDVLNEAGHIPPEFLLRHKHGDWGELDDEDVIANDRALLHGSRLLSAYRTRLGEKLWVITEWDRSVTTLLVPADY